MIFFLFSFLFKKTIMDDNTGSKSTDDRRQLGDRRQPGQGHQKDKRNKQFYFPKLQETKECHPFF